MLTIYHLSLLLVLSTDALSSISSTSCSHQTRSLTRKHFSISTSHAALHSHRNRTYSTNRGSKSYRSELFHEFHERGCTSCRLSPRTRIDDDSAEYEKQADEISISHNTYKHDVEPILTPLYQLSPEISRRTALINSLTLLILSSGIAETSSASEIDTTGQLFTPKNVMIKGGGSTSARGTRLKPIEEKASKNRKNESLLNSKSGLIQTVYETRFITYLARFLLVFDPSANAWWKKNSKASVLPTDTDNNLDITATSDITKERFAEFAESVEIGLADYFLGPYGSYASVAAAKAGLAAVEPAKSVRVSQDKNSFWSVFLGRGERDDESKKQPQSKSITSKRKSNNAQQDGTNLARQGVLNLFSLLKARYTSIEEKQQLAILFSLISTPELQPVQQIRGLLGEIDNGTLAAVELFDLSTDDDEENPSIDGENYRLSSRLGGGFSKLDEEVVKVDPPAPLGDDYKPARLRAIMEPTSRILRINVIDGGNGYTAAPDVIIKQSGVSRKCEACAILDRNGSIAEVVVINPGFGYGGKHNNRKKFEEPILPTVEFRERKGRPEKRAKAVPELEYKVVGVDIIDGGSGYLFDEPPRVSLDLPSTDPDWFATPVILRETEEEEETQLILASVTQMKNGTSGVVIDTSSIRRERYDTKLADDTIQSIQKDPTALLPSDTRPQFSKFRSNSSPDVIENGYYSIATLPPIQSRETQLSSKYRSIDPLFGGIGKAPVTKNALTLSSSQYFRLALSGALCTVVVRTALNPLELVKTKIQLGNDEEIIHSAMNKSSSVQVDPDSTSGSKPGVGTAQVIQSLIEVRGPLSLFQSADITLLTSIVFGLFGFGATELFRRSFSVVFFDEAAGGPSELLLLLAAGLATLLTCAAGAPFEILRVRSMSTTTSQSVKQVFEEFVEQNRSKRISGMSSAGSTTTVGMESAAILPTGVQLEDIKPLWSSFLPIVSRELPFALTKFLVFDLASGTIADLINGSSLLGDEEIKVGVGGMGLLLSAFSGGLAGIAGAFVSHPADLVLTLTSASSREQGKSKDWKVIVKELIAADGGVLNLFAAFPARAIFFFLVIGLQFFLYDYIKTLLDVGTDDLQLVLDVFYAVRQGLS